MSFIELISFSKVFSVALYLDNKSILSRQDLEITSEVLKRMADESPYWTHEQREMYKIIVDFVKQELDAVQ